MGSWMLGANFLTGETQLIQIECREESKLNYSPLWINTKLNSARKKNSENVVAQSKEIEYKKKWCKRNQCVRKWSFFCAITLCYPLGIHHHLVVSTFSVFLPNKNLYQISLKPSNNSFFYFVITANILLAFDRFAEGNIKGDQIYWYRIFSASTLHYGKNRSLETKPIFTDERGDSQR